jgi:putative DNA methylase
MTTWGDLVSSRPALALATLVRLVGKVEMLQANKEHMETLPGDESVETLPATSLLVAVQTCLALAVDRQADALSSLVTWTPRGEFQGHTFARQVLPMVWDFAEVTTTLKCVGTRSLMFRFRAWHV